MRTSAVLAYSLPKIIRPFFLHRFLLMPFCWFLEEFVVCRSLKRTQETLFQQRHYENFITLSTSGVLILTHIYHISYQHLASSSYLYLNSHEDMVKTRSLKKLYKQLGLVNQVTLAVQLPGGDNQQKEKMPRNSYLRRLQAEVGWLDS